MRRTYAASTLVAAFVLLVAACSPGHPSRDATGIPGQAAEFAHAQCMRDHGIDWSDPQFADGEWKVRPSKNLDLESPAFKKAETECAKVRQDVQPDAGVDPADRAQLEKDMEKMLKFAACMRGQGIDFPDPKLDSDGGGISGPTGPPVDGDKETFNRAKRACEEQTGAPMP
jgi:hypothetical protein